MLHDPQLFERLCKAQNERARHAGQSRFDNVLTAVLAAARRRIQSAFSRAWSAGDTVCTPESTDTRSSRHGAWMRRDITDARDTRIVAATP
jgi:hypothetical protein